MPQFAAALLVVAVTAGCGGKQNARAPFVARGAFEIGPISSLWGDGSSGPTGSHLGCIDGRRIAVLVTVHNRTTEPVKLLGGSDHESVAVIDRIAVQVRLAPPPPKGDLAQIGLRSWSGRASGAVTIPPGRDAWVQSNFELRHCLSLATGTSVTANRSLTLAYRVGRRDGSEDVSMPSARIVLTAGPVHPRLPINTTG